MFDTPIFEGTIDELIERKAEFAGQHLALFTAPDTEEIDVPTPRTTIRSKEHLEEMLLAAQNSPLEPMTDNDWVYVREELARRIAAREAGKSK